MDIKELSKLYYLVKMIDRDTQRLEELEARLQGGQAITGMPRAPGARDLIGELVPLIVDMKRQIEERRKQCIEEKAKLEQYITGVEDDRLRLIFLLRFVDLMTWNQVADAVGGNNTESSVKKACYRYLRTEWKTKINETCPICPEDM